MTSSRSLTTSKISSAIKSTRSEEHTSELQSLRHLVCRLLLEKKKIRADCQKRFAQLYSRLIEKHHVHEVVEPVETPLGLITALDGTPTGLGDHSNLISSTHPA